MSGQIQAIMAEQVAPGDRLLTENLLCCGDAGADQEIVAYAEARSTKLTDAQVHGST